MMKIKEITIICLEGSYRVSENIKVNNWQEASEVPMDLSNYKKKYIDQLQIWDL